MKVRKPVEKPMYEPVQRSTESFRTLSKNESKQDIAVESGTSSKKYYSNVVGRRYEDQIVPARRQGAVNLEE